ncbi:sigma-70 family RNA polymerase sigma factor [Kitasatospora sp. NPDC052896]|uniref:BACON domain-containing protein n=1 Tax=Kitasatospora sp. NPDC052896 TaxID=3364061 RepID=UPI0037C8018F
MTPRTHPHERAATDPRADAVLPAFEQLADGLFTYCLSALCAHDPAVAAVREVRALALANRDRLADPGLLRAWLYSLARYTVLGRLAPAGDTPAGDTPCDHAPDAQACPSPAEAARRQRELTELTWPEAAGTTAEQREALELAVRHGLTPLEVAAVLGLDDAAARQLLAAGAAELTRTRTALLVLRDGSCPELTRLGGAGTEHWPARVLGPALRRELLRHVTQCPTCRGTAERVAGALGDGLTGPAGPTLLPAPVTVRLDADAEGADGWSGHVPPPRLGRSPGVAFLTGAAAGRRAAASRATAPAPTGRAALHFDRRGFPRHRAPGFLDRHRAGGDLHERAVLVRQRTVTTGVLAAVLAAPLGAFWLAHRDGTGSDPAATVSSVRVDDDPAGGPVGGPTTAGPGTGPLPTPGSGGAAPARALVSRGGTVGPGGTLTAALVGRTPAETLLPPVQGAAVPVPALGAVPLSSPVLRPAPVPPPPSTAGAQLTVQAAPYGNRTVITLIDSGNAPIDWEAVPSCDWLRLSRDSGTLAPGQRITVTVTVDEDRAPQTQWTAQISLPPSEAVVTLAGGPTEQPTPPTAAPSSPVTSNPSASANPSGSASSTPSVSPSSGSSASSAPSNSVSPSASPTSGTSAVPSARPSSTPSELPPSPAPTSTTSHSSSPAR